ncbi:MAG: hypothetical protein JNK37_19180 [Verrucomicrobiales bacterium]|nr:hypothetical protein [Verrucomicrobiales bacterium]
MTTSLLLPPIILYFLATLQAADPIGLATDYFQYRLCTGRPIIITGTVSQKRTQFESVRFNSEVNIEKIKYTASELKISNVLYNWSQHLPFYSEFSNPVEIFSVPVFWEPEFEKLLPNLNNKSLFIIEYNEQIKAYYIDLLLQTEDTDRINSIISTLDKERKKR